MISVPIGLIGLFIILPLIVNLVVFAVIAHRYVDIIEGCLSNCSFVSTIREAWSGGGLLGEVIRSGMIAMVLMMPKLFAEKGIVDQEEIRNLPALYKGMLVVPMTVNFFLFVALMCLRFSGYLLGL
ncbi:hypothetical protein [Pseudomonas viridiflava]|uniref:Uncharacterized protein n=1 Tax=Pseudomonas viridiflava TaxID=33069 RepID=A0ABU7N4E3_PSEVI|nr:hypothetical protein [Pseudomonas viridiflava]KIQ37064.1 hypothetical protein RT94_03455 [Pseudomonas viridiflava]MEE3934981.1 hypothetical protein [Pseudomonas viridiflava]MEE4039797.1 hypothetical protein [Pseudomonas viridiflava]MEE4061169.1 hypothetical protein [Pseudomonas viridiflava]MEE4169707.1 hypothetical protein [Pseudomonas viridiflava]